MRIMALDIGEVRTGIAISDPGERVASPVAVLPSAEVRSCAKSFKRVLEDWEPSFSYAACPTPWRARKARKPSASAPTPPMFRAVRAFPCSFPTSV